MVFFIILHEFIPLHHVILLKALLCSYELNTLDACWIAVDVWSNSSRCRIISVYLSQTWCLYIMIMPRYSHNYSLFYQLLDSNLFTHRNTYAILREATSETYGPWVYLLSYKLSIYFYLHLYFSNLYHKIPKIFILSYYLYQISLLHVDMKGLTTPLLRWLRGSCLFV